MQSVVGRGWDVWGRGGESSLTVQTTATECVNDSRLVITGDLLIPSVAVRLSSSSSLGDGGWGVGCFF